MRKLTVIEAGQLFHDDARRLLNDLAAAKPLVREGWTTPSDRLKLSVTADFGQLHVLPELPTFFPRCPNVAVEIAVNDQTAHLTERRADVAILIGHLIYSSLLVCKIAVSKNIVVAT